MRSSEHVRRASNAFRRRTRFSHSIATSVSTITARLSCEGRRDRDSSPGHVRRHARGPVLADDDSPIARQCHPRSRDALGIAPSTRCVHGSADRSSAFVGSRSSGGCPSAGEAARSTRCRASTRSREQEVARLRGRTGTRSRGTRAGESSRGASISSTSSVTSAALVSSVRCPPGRIRAPSASRRPIDRCTDRDPPTVIHRP